MTAAWTTAVPSCGPTASPPINSAPQLLKLNNKFVRRLVAVVAVAAQLIERQEYRLFGAVVFFSRSETHSSGCFNHCPDGCICGTLLQTKTKQTVAHMMTPTSTPAGSPKVGFCVSRAQSRCFCDNLVIRYQARSLVSTASFRPFIRPEGDCDKVVTVTATVTHR